MPAMPTMQTKFAYKRKLADKRKLAYAYLSEAEIQKEISVAKLITRGNPSHLGRSCVYRASTMFAKQT